MVFFQTRCRSFDAAHLFPLKPVSFLAFFVLVVPVVVADFPGRSRHDFPCTLVENGSGNPIGFPRPVAARLAWAVSDAPLSLSRACGNLPHWFCRSRHSRAIQTAVVKHG